MTSSCRNRLPVDAGRQLSAPYPAVTNSRRSDGGIPNGFGLGSDGNFYGTTAYGGKFNNGVFFQIDPTESPG